MLAAALRDVAEGRPSHRHHEALAIIVVCWPAKHRLLHRLLHRILNRGQPERAVVHPHPWPEAGPEHGHLPVHVVKHRVDERHWTLDEQLELRLLALLARMPPGASRGTRAEPVLAPRVDIFVAALVRLLGWPWLRHAAKGCDTTVAVRTWSVHDVHCVGGAHIERSALRGRRRGWRRGGCGAPHQGRNKGVEVALQVPTGGRWRCTGSVRERRRCAKSPKRRRLMGRGSGG
mmetsp:Transcript_6597/g.17109  ORF Transcript_6597/g.17109 Transcript_6597/m.17109 type:complete len:232 (-) Transcript_6597:197-892(-)